MLDFSQTRSSSFHYLNATQFLGALNDNIYKLLVVYFLIQQWGIEFSHQILATTAAIFVIPFLLFSSVAGVMADRFSKKKIIIFTKGLEVLVMLLGLLAFIFNSVEGAYIVLFLSALQSALFSPSKYGIVPELVPTSQVSKANGLLTSFTYLAIILGSCLASFLTQMTHKNFILCSYCCLIIALIGFVTSLRIENTPASGSKKQFQWFFLQEIYEAIKLSRQHLSLFSSMIGAAYFLFIATFIQLNTIPYAIETLYLTDVEGGYLFFFPALGIGIGALLAGKWSGPLIELGLVPIGALGGALFVFLLSLGIPSLSIVILFLILFGISGGIYEVPLDAYIQVMSPIQSRGQLLATSNFLSFVASLLASGVIYLNTEFLSLNAKGSFLVLGSITLGIALIFTYKFFDPLIRLMGRIRIWVAN
jgi:acyl-[acyl-carrier-protein]-phospholipid O-acyltransferase/long-chain-fatty-acid--[acyl-carrier-protein] ligase